MRVPFIVYADFECFTESISTCTSNDSRSYTEKYQKHNPSGFCYLIKCFDDSIFPSKLVKYTAELPDEDIPQIFVERLEADFKTIYESFTTVNKKMIMTAEDEISFLEGTHCHICEGVLRSDRVRDHDHLTGNFRGAAHDHCNKDFQVPKYVPVVFHNLSGYDAHLFVNNLGITKGKIRCLPTTDEKYISFSKDIVMSTSKGKDGKNYENKLDIRFIDSFRFMQTSLAKLVENLPSRSFKNLKRFYKGDKFGLLRRKGVFPYDWFNNFENLNANKLLPIDNFYSKLYDCGITYEGHFHAEKVWETFGIRHSENIMTPTSYQTFYS